VVGDSPFKRSVAPSLWWNFFDPNPVEAVQRPVGHKPGRDESAEDFRIMASGIRRLHTNDAELMESEIIPYFPERSVRSAERKGDRGAVGYWTCSVQRAPERMGSG